MTPEERKLIDDLFDRLARLESNERDPEAERAIAEGLKRAPHAAYALVQTVLVQDEALKRADARIRELTEEPPPPEQHGSFLDTMRSALGGRTSVPSVAPGAGGGPDPRWNQGGTGYSGPGSYAAPPQSMPPPGSGGGSFLGTAAASAAGAIGGALLLNSISSMFGNRGGGSAFGAVPQQTSPWDNSASGSDLARDAGLGDVGRTGQTSDDSQAAGLFGGDDSDDSYDSDDSDSSDSGDFGSDDSA